MLTPDINLASSHIASIICLVNDVEQDSNPPVVESLDRLSRTRGLEQMRNIKTLGLHLEIIAVVEERLIHGEVQQDLVAA